MPVKLMNVLTYMFVMLNFVSISFRDEGGLIK